MNNQKYKEQFYNLLLSVNSRKNEVQNICDFINNTDFFTAPANTRFHGAYVGGLVEHSLETYQHLKNLYKLYQSRLPNPINEDSLVITALLHDVYKINFYQSGTKNVKNEETGVWEKQQHYFIDDQIPLGHGEKSVIILQQYIKLTADEIYAIRWHMGGFDDAGRSYGGGMALGAAMDKCPLLVLLYMADMAANYITKV